MVARPGPACIAPVGVPNVATAERLGAELRS